MINVSEIYKHEGYSHTIAIHDIALVRLSGRLLLSLNIATVELYKGENITHLAERKQRALLLGWGINETNGALQQQLQKVEINLITLEECQHQTASLLHGSNFCAGAMSPAIHQGQCNGDSGGPLLINKQQVGVVSWSLKPCGAYPGIFTNVAHYTKWIFERMENYV